MSILSLLPIMIVFVGGILLIKLDFFYILHPIRTLRFTFKGHKSKESAISLMLALAGTLGVGNIVGVAYGIYRGGPGSVFWLVVSAVFSSIIKYAEVSLSAKYKTGYGIISVIDGGKAPNAISKSYALLTLILSLAMGSLLQAQAIYDSSEFFSGWRTFILPIVFVFTAFTCFSGKERIKKAVAIVLPAVTLLYTGMCFTVVFMEFKSIPQMLEKILRSAFDFDAIGGGLSAFIVSSGIKEGFARGLLSNEAGAGTSSFSHTSHSTDCGFYKNEKIDARRAGVYGILEVVVDTLILCPLTASVILLADTNGDFCGTLPELAHIFDRYVGHGAPLMLFISITAFAVSTALCWYYYGKVSLSYLAGGRYSCVFSAIFIISFAVGLVFKIDVLFYLNDIVLFLLSIITLHTVMKNRALLEKPE